MSDLCLVINTCKGYYSNINNLIKQIIELDANEIIPRENILIVSGQEDKNSVIYKNDIKIVKVTYTGLHLTSCIYINENMNELKKQYKYFFILPDTIEIGNNFFNILNDLYNKYIKNSNMSSFPLLNWNVRPTMDIGILHHTHITNMSEYLNKIKICQPYTKDDLKKLKLKLIYNENIILGLPSYWSEEYQIDFKNKIDPTRVYPIISDKDDITETIITQNNRTINQVYFKTFDLYKFQRNFAIDNELVLDL
jgi:hypothetical protein